MIVQPDFADHWKTELLIRLCGTESAVRCLLRFWSHCQNRKQWEFTNLNPEILASICRWQGDAQVFWEAMNQTFIDRTGDTHTAHEWGEINSQLTHNWEAGKKGGRPKKNPTETQGFSQGLPKGSNRDNPTETLGVTDREDREEKIEEMERTPSEEVVSAWNSLGDPFPKVVKLSDGRAKAVRERLKDRWWRENYLEGIERVRASKFCRGNNDRKWVADFEFFVRPDSLAKIMEGKYGPVKASKPVTAKKDDFDPSTVGPMPGWMEFLERGRKERERTEHEYEEIPQ